MTSRPGLIGRIARILRPPSAPASHEDSSSADRRWTGSTETVEIVPPPPSGLVIAYAPEVDGEPDAGEVVWTWVPYDERDGRGKDRPVLVIARRDEDRVYAVRLTSKPHDGDRDYLSLGSGEWDSAGRPSWVDIEQIYLVHRDGMRREASVLDAARFSRVADALQQRYGWDSRPARH
ncbi:type II toxin-antitoxin system PemK/MazF family toxin [Microbacterium sp. NPDC057407]|uniref:type II toxin-antitoxin system PemK/MazF family toxin n=1 Tax=Microbacterium sp. NPDC057407 TaxID=3346120 RepID=UPI0036709DAD